MALAPDSHLRLGIALAALTEFTDDTLKFPQEYTRDEAEHAWITQSVGPWQHEKVKGDWKNLTGYDYAAAVRKWLKMTRNDDKSVCEVLHNSGVDSAVMKNVGECMMPFPGFGRMPAVAAANIFYSHMQLPEFSSQGVTGAATMTRIRNGDYFHSGAKNLPPENQRFWWIDYVCLRQCRDDFNVMSVRALIKDIGCTMVEVDKDMSYMRRTFCLLELFSTEESGGKVLFNTTLQPDDVKKILECHPIDTAAAEARRPKDKEQIDQFIRDTVGFEKLNSVVTQQLLALPKRWGVTSW